MKAMGTEDLGEYDFVIVGTGAGGATAARVLSEAGHRVAMLEEGARVAASERSGPLIEALQKVIRDFATATTSGFPPTPILQGRCVGGSTAINSGIIWRMQEDTRVDWMERFGLADLVAAEHLDPIYAQIERELEIETTSEDVLGNNAKLLRRGAEALGLKGRPMTRNAARCKGSARCLQGCVSEARQSMDVSYVPFAERHGATVFTHSKAMRVLIERGRAIGVEGFRLSKEPNASARHRDGRFTVRGKRGVIVAASAIHTPVLLKQSGLRNRSIGQGLQSHPGLAVVGRFEEEVHMGIGATQGYEVPMRDRGYKLESLSLPSEMLAVRLPGTGAAWQERLLAMGHMAQWCVQVRMQTRGKVRPSVWTPFPVVWYRPTEADLIKLHEALLLLIRMMFAAGACEVYPGVACWPEVLTSPTQMAALEQEVPKVTDVHLIMSHLFGTARAHQEASQGVVKPSLESHDVRGLYVMDASVLPTNMGVNPQHTIMATTWRAAGALR